VKRFFKGSYLSLILIFLYAPILILIVFSFNESRFMSSWTGFSLKWYAELFRDRVILDALFVTLRVALVSMAAATVIGTLAAIGIHSLRKFPRAAAETVTTIPIVNPDIVTGVSLMLLFIFLSIPRGEVTLYLAHITFNIPYVIFSVLPKLRQMQPQLYEAALDLGAKPFYALRKVILPEIMPGVFTGALLAFTLSLDDFVISLFATQGSVANLSIAIYSMVKAGIKPKINALSAIMFVTVLALLLIVNFRASRDGAGLKLLKRKKKEIAA
jgi:spermidine/putrescine transport system permease protein